MSEMMIKNSLVKIKDAPPYTPDMEGKVLLNSMARASLDPKTGSYTFRENMTTKIQLDEANVKAVSDIISGGGLANADSDDFLGVGVDQGPSHESTRRQILITR
jgi:fatty acid synthase subunit beta